MHKQRNEQFYKKKEIYNKIFICLNKIATLIFKMKKKSKRIEKLKKKNKFGSSTDSLGRCGEFWNAPYHTHWHMTVRSFCLNGNWAKQQNINLNSISRKSSHQTEKFTSNEIKEKRNKFKVCLDLK